MQGEFLVWHVMIFKLWLLSSQKQQKKAEESKKQLSLEFRESELSESP